MDNLEQMDIDTLDDFGQWLENQGLQAIATRVSTGSECSIIIEDGMVVQSAKEAVLQNTNTQTSQEKSWKAGTF